MKPFRTLVAMALGLIMATPSLAAETLRPQHLLTGAIDRSHDELSGQWTYSKDLYRTGLTDINGWVAKSRMQRYRDIDVAAVEAKGGVDFFEFDMDRGPRMTIPGAWNAAEPELRYYDGLIWFQRKFTPKDLKGGRAFLRFEAVNYHAHVYLNGEKIGEHEGGYTPFSFEVTDKLRAGENRLTVGVDSEHGPQTIPTGITDWDIYGGIIRPVRLIYTPQTYIDDAVIELTTDGRLKGTAKLDGPQAAGQTVNVTVSGLAVKLSATTDANGYARFDAKAPRNLKKWSPETPTLYDVSFATSSDRLDDRVGFRTIEVDGDRILLNGKSIFLRGVSLHEEEFGPNPARNMTEQASRALLSEIKYGMNGNYVRLSHYPHSDVTVRMADELGLLVWSEIPVYWTVDWENPNVLLKARTMLAEMIYRDRNRASVIMWSVGNETPVTDSRNAFHSALADTVRDIDPSRLISAALLVEGRTENGQTTIFINDPLVDKLDVMAVNTYAGWYGSNTLEELPSLRWEVPAGKPVVLSEFGADALAGLREGDGIRGKYTEDFQAEYYRQTLKMADNIPQLRGMSPWILKDFQSLRREHPVIQNGWNRKGLVSETGVRKLAFDVMANYYKAKTAETPK